MSEERKVLLSLNDVEVKFNVRGRVLTAIRGVTFDIYENESIAIVGESGSGKSVLTKTFTGMLESNGFISKGSVIYQDDQLSKIHKVLTKRDLHRYHKLVAFLDEAAKATNGKEVYHEMQNMKQAFKNAMRLSKEEQAAYAKKIDDLNFEKVELFNKKMADDKRDAKKEKTLKIKEIEKQIKQLKKEEKAIAKERKLKLLKDKEYVQNYKEKMASLIKQHAALIKDAKVSSNTKLQNRLFAKEILLSIERYSPVTQFFYLNSLKDRFQEAYKKGMEMNDQTIEKLYELITFRVIFKHANNHYFNALDKKEERKLAAENRELLANMRRTSKYRMIKSFADSIHGNANFVRLVIDELIKSNDYNHVEELLQTIYEREVMKVGSELEGYTILDLTKIKTAADWQKIRGSRIATVFQDPMTSLNPIVTIGKQITEVIMKHQNCSAAEAEKRAIYMMERVGIPDAAKRFKEYPFQYSGGMRQRIVIAIALSCQPKVLICDEPTTALDVTIQAQIIDLIKDLQKEFKFTTVYITHDLGVVASVADRVAVLYAGQIVEAGTVQEIFYDPKHPYTWALLSSLPQLAEKGKELFSIHGTPPSLYNVIEGDAFAERNPFCLAIDLKYEPPCFYVSETHFAKTWLLDPRAPKIEKPTIIQNIHEKLEKAQAQLNKEEYDYVRYNKQRGNLINTEYRHRLSKR